MSSIPENGSKSLLLDELHRLITSHRTAFRQERCFRRMASLTVAMVFCFGRRTITQMLMTLGLTDVDHSAMYRLFSQERFDVDRLCHCLFSETVKHVDEDDLYVIGTDGTQIPRSSVRMPGTSWMRSPRSPVFMMGVHRVQRFVHGCWFTAMENGYTRAIPLRFIPAFPEKAVKAKGAACKEWEAAISFVTWVRKELDALRPQQKILWLADGSYDTVGVWKALPERVIAAIRTAKNRALYAYLPPQERRGNRKYSERMPKPEEWFKEWRSGTRRVDVLVRGKKRRLRYRLVGPVVRKGAPDVPLYLMVVSGQTYKSGKAVVREKQRRPAVYLISAQWLNGEWRLPLEPSRLLAWLWQRWEMEVAHREMKSSLGVGEQQCWNARSTIVSVQWSVWVYAILVLAGYRTWRLSPGPAPIARWSQRPLRWSFNTLWRTYRLEFWNLPPNRPSWTPTSGNWPDPVDRMNTLWNSIGGVVRA